MLLKGPMKRNNYNKKLCLNKLFKLLVNKMRIKAENHFVTIFVNIQQRR